jgi:hypothetical protein
VDLLNDPEVKKNLKEIFENIIERKGEWKIGFLNIL